MVTMASENRLFWESEEKKLDALIKRTIEPGMETDLATGLTIESNAYPAPLPTEDRKKGLETFHEKQTPKNRGK
jgi:enoyl-CoA hydratase